MSTIKHEATANGLCVVIRVIILARSGRHRPDKIAPLVYFTRNSAIADKPRDAFRGQSRSPNMVPFHMLGMVSYYCSVVTLSVRRTVFEILEFKNAVTLKTGLGS